MRRRFGPLLVEIAFRAVVQATFWRTCQNLSNRCAESGDSFQYS
jgi:hypothetical protein